MALFGSKKKTPTKKTTAKAVAPNALSDVMKTISTGSKKSVGLPVVKGLRQVLKRPRITEKAANLTTQNVYTFDVAQDASKHDIVKAVMALYKVKPIRVNVVNTRGKRVSLRTRRGYGVQNDMRKAYIYLKEGDKIDFAS